MKSVEFVFDFGSPSSYLAYARLMRLARDRAIEIVWTPVLLGAVLQAVGSVAPTTFPAKEKWFFGDLAACADKHHVPFSRNPFFPLNTLALMRGATALLGTAQFSSYVKAVFEALWKHNENLADPQVVERVLAPVGLDARQFEALISHAEVKSLLRKNTEDALERGVFGCPTFFVGDRLIFGQDRLEFVEEALVA
ncbi:2-hydroxychromene-2-carboxylate isomerase [Pseudomonas sp. NPDC088368]|uniref:2-hydroxychromene-2-carboxylate isomerase n=1 Tax=Pseudomonas sp. NPDC088368 TaxID=3364453 RepID=UPI00381FDA46